MSSFHNPIAGSHHYEDSQGSMPFSVKTQSLNSFTHLLLVSIRQHFFKQQQTLNPGIWKNSTIKCYYNKWDNQTTLYINTDESFMSMIALKLNKPKQISTIHQNPKSPNQEKLLSLKLNYEKELKKEKPLFSRGRLSSKSGEIGEYNKVELIIVVNFPQFSDIGSSLTESSRLSYLK